MKLELSEQIAHSFMVYNKNYKNLKNYNHYHNQNWTKSCNYDLQPLHMHCLSSAVGRTKKGAAISFLKCIIDTTLILFYEIVL